MRIIDDVKLDFKDVLILPKRSTLESRSQVDLQRTFKFKNSGMTWTGIPIIVSNMDTTGTFEMAKELYKFKMLTCIHKHYSLEDWGLFFQDLQTNYSQALGAFQRQQQAGLDAMRANLMQQAQEPFTRLQIGQNLLQGMPSASIPSTFQQATTPSANPFLQGVGAYTTLSQIAPFGGATANRG